jgi:hypothetical protein
MFYLIWRAALAAPGVVMERLSLAFRNLLFKQVCVSKIGGMSNFAENNESQVRFPPKWKILKGISPSVTGLDLFRLRTCKAHRLYKSLAI